eukprot:gene8617-8798_t
MDAGQLDVAQIKVEKPSPDDCHRFAALPAVQLGKQRTANQQNPIAALSRAITNVLELSKLYPKLDVRQLLVPAVTMVQLNLSLEKAKQMQRLLPDSALVAEVLKAGPHEISDKISVIMSTFKSVLSMEPPSQLISHPWTFTKALRLPPHKLAQHLQALLDLTPHRSEAQRLAIQHIGVLVSHRGMFLLSTGVRRMAAAFELESLAEAVEMVLAHPHLARTSRQLQHVEDMLQGATEALNLPKPMICRTFMQHPGLFSYDSTTELANKYHPLRAALPGASHEDVLKLCSLLSVRRAATASSVISSLQVSASIYGHSSPVDLLPLLLAPKQLTKGQQAYRNHAIGRPPYGFLLQDAATTVGRANQLVDLMGFTKDDVHQLMRWSPRTGLARDRNTQELKLQILQSRLLADRQNLAGRSPRLAPEVTRMIRRHPMVLSLAADSWTARLQGLEGLLQLDTGQVSQLVLREPQLLLRRPEALERMMKELVQLLDGDGEAARKLVLEEPKVLQDDC